MDALLTIILLGIVEGVTEFIPVSSTGHLILAGELLGYDAAEWAVFNVVIQLGAILAVIVLYWRTFVEVLLGLFDGDGEAWRFLRNIVLAFLPSAGLGLALHRQIEAMLGSPMIVAVALVAGGFAILFLEWRHERAMKRKRDQAAAVAAMTAEPLVAGPAPAVVPAPFRISYLSALEDVADMSWRTALGIGLIQCLSMIPGVSRSGATIMGALSLGVRRRTAAVFSFFLAVPTMIGASTLELVENRHDLGAVDASGIAIGFLVSFVVAIVVIHWFIGIVSRHGFAPFAWYRILVGTAALVWLVAR